VPVSPDDHSNDTEDLEPLIDDIKALLSNVARRFEAEDGEEWRWIAQHCANPAIIEILRDTTLTMMRVLDAIEQLEPVNGITISKQYGIPKGSVSKSTRRLITQKLVSKEALPKNKKEVLFRMTPLGRELVLAHRAFDEQMERGFNQFLERYKTDELRLMVRVLQDVMKASFLYPEPQLSSHEQ
jgi:DNA-binding MarR family transcriptional regulator